jgi:hypothetical protein
MMPNPQIKQTGLGREAYVVRLPTLEILGGLKPESELMTDFNQQVLLQGALGLLI